MNMTITALAGAIGKAGSDGLDTTLELQALAERFRKNTAPIILRMKDDVSEFESECKQVINGINAHTERIRKGIL
ncbi:MAG: hypothetical protein EHM85_19755 [Desulfobacteraceae bacterium]|nr:MAG: hypothetical protein EHM85_19755 [Desulfobacteraceae bacterium]